MVKIRSKIVSLVLIPFSAVVVGMYVILGMYSQLMADDFCSVYYSERLGVLRSAWYWYISWYGGYSASFADGLLGLFGRNGIGFVGPLTLGVWALVLTWFTFLVLQYFGFGGQRLVSAAVSLLVITATIVVSPDPSKSVVWWAGLRGYIPPLVLFPLYLSLLFLFLRTKHSGNKNVFWYIASFVDILIIGGFSEPFTPLLLILLTLLFILDVVVARGVWFRPSRIFILAGLLGGITALALMVLAPGNAHRQAFYPPPPPPFEIVILALRFYLEFWRGVLIAPIKSSMLIGVFLGSLVIGSMLTNQLVFKVRDVGFVILASMFFAFCCFPPAAYGQASAPSDTSLITPSYFLAWGTILAGFISGQILAKDASLPSRAFEVTLCVAVVLSLGYSVVVKAIDLNKEMRLAATYASEWKLRDQTIKKALLAGQTEVYVLPLPNWITMEPNDNPKFFVNQCMSLYYKTTIVSSADANK